MLATCLEISRSKGLCLDQTSWWQCLLSLVLLLLLFGVAMLQPRKQSWLSGWCSTRAEWGCILVLQKPLTEQPISLTTHDSTFRSWWWTGRPGMLQFMGSQRVRHDWVTELNWTEGSPNSNPMWPLKVGPYLQHFPEVNTCLWRRKQGRMTPSFLQLYGPVITQSAKEPYARSHDKWNLGWRSTPKCLGQHFCAHYTTVHGNPGSVDSSAIEAFH